MKALLLCISFFASNAACADTPIEIEEMSATKILQILKGSAKPVSLFAETTLPLVLCERVLYPITVYNEVKKIVNNSYELVNKTTPSLRPELANLITRAILKDYPKAIEQLERNKFLPPLKND